MEFLVVLAALLLHRMMPDLGWLQRDGWYRQWVKQLSGNRGPLLRYSLSLILPVAALVLVVHLVGLSLGLLAVFVIQLLVLLYCFGRGNLNGQLRTLEEDFGRHDTQAAFHAASVFNVARHQNCAETDEEFHVELVYSVSYRYFEHWFPVLFWFVAFGLPGALLYRLAEIHSDCELDEGKERELAARWLWVMEWIPARLLGLTFALVGNFGSCIRNWQECLICTVRKTRDVIGHYVEGALSADLDCRDMEVTVVELEMIRSLFSRALVLWMCVIALLVFV